MEFFQIVPGDNPDLGDYRSKDPADTNNYTVISYGNCLIISYSAHLIIKQAAPAVKPYMIYSLSRKLEGSAGHIPGVDYGPANEIAEQYTCWLAICGSVPGEDWGHFWRNLLSQEEKTDEEILLDAWGGPGNMWVFVRPDRYITSLPILQLTKQAQDFQLQRLSRRCHCLFASLKIPQPCRQQETASSFYPWTSCWLSADSCPSDPSWLLSRAAGRFVHKYIRMLTQLRAGDYSKMSLGFFQLDHLSRGTRIMGEKRLTGGPLSGLKGGFFYQKWKQRFPGLSTVGNAAGA